MSDVVNIFKNKDKPKEKQDDGSTEGFDFNEIMRKNAENKDRIAKERSRQNKGVVRSHRLKK